MAGSLEFRLRIIPMQISSHFRGKKMQLIKITIDALMLLLSNAWRLAMKPLALVHSSIFL